MNEARIPKTGETMTNGKGGKPVDKVERFGWTQTGNIGKNQEIHKDKLQIDHAYQRDNVHRARVNRIAREWDWTKLGRIIVSDRGKGEYFTVDGQHRVLAARNRSDVQMLPCVVHKFEDRSEEALAFRDINANRGPVSAFHRFRASLAGGDTKSHAIHSLVAKHGYSLTLSGKSARTVSCVGLLLRCYDEDHSALLAAFHAACEVANGKHILDEIMRGLFYLQRHLQKLKLGSVTDDDYLDKLKAAGVDEIRRAIGNCKAAYVSSTHKVCAQGMINVINRRKRNKIPNVIDMPE